MQGDPNDINDFLCICPSCHQGRLCEFSLQAFGFTLDSLLVFDSIIVHSIYVVLAFLLFICGLVNNICSFVTFKRSQPRKFGVGNYLFVVTILNQCALLTLLLKFVYIIVGSSNASCKTISYLASIFTRSTYWLTSWVTIDRLLIILFPTATAFKNPRLSIISTHITFFVILGTHVHELFFYITIQSYGSSICVSNFDRSWIVLYNRVNTLVHYLVPFFIQIISITLLNILAARSRAKTTEGNTTFVRMLKKQFRTQKELYITPGIIILSALPQAILSFSLACTQLSTWQRHALLAAFLFSYTPQVLGFILFVLPSSAYKKEFARTLIAKKLFKSMIKTQGNELITTTTMRSKPNRRPLA